MTEFEHPYTVVLGESVSYNLNSFFAAQKVTFSFCYNNAEHKVNVPYLVK